MIYIFLPSIRNKGYALCERLSQDHSSNDVHVVMDRKPGGFWVALNRMVARYKPERFVWLSDDCDPHDSWLEALTKCWDENFSDGLGLVTCDDLHIRYAGAAFAMTTPAFMYVIFGARLFPGEFSHHFLDTLFADRAKDLGKYHFCENSVVEHLHWKIGKSPLDDVYKKTQKDRPQDKLLKDAMDREWLEFERENALARLEEMEKHANP